jgi:DNA-directed RNA polymerase subunit H
LEKQDYNISDYEDFSINEIDAMFTNNQLDMLVKGEESDKKIYIKYYLGKMVRPANIQEMVDDLFNLEVILTKDDTLFIIIKEDMNDTLINELKHIWEKDGIFIVIQNIKRLQFNILDHVLVPNHRVMKNSEISEIMKKYNISDMQQFPDISRFDPVAQVIGLRPGKVCEITRTSKTAIEAKYYRVCI